MKKLLLIISFLFIYSINAQEDLFMYDYRNVPAEEMDTFMQNEAIFWSKVHSNMQKKGHITGWAMLRKVGGLESEPNIYFYVGIGSYENLDNVGKNYSAAEKEVMDGLDWEMKTLIKKRLKQKKYRVGNVLLNRTANAGGGVGDFNYLVHNYVKANNVSEFVDVQEKYFKPFFDEHIKAGNTKQTYWNVAAVVNPRGHGYNWNCYTADAYKNMSDIYNAWNTEITWPQEGFELANKLMDNKGFYKMIIWHKLMWLDGDGNYKSIWD